MLLFLGNAPFSSIAPQRLGAAVVPILLSEVKQKQRPKRPSKNGDREAIVVVAGFRDGECERAFTEHDLILGEERRVWCS